MLCICSYALSTKHSLFLKGIMVRGFLSNKLLLIHLFAVMEKSVMFNFSICCKWNQHFSQNLTFTVCLTKKG